MKELEMQDKNVKGGSRNEGTPVTREPQFKEYTFTELQIEAAKLRGMGLTLREIGEKLGRDKEKISEVLSRFETVAKRMYSAVKELSSAGYWEFLATKTVKPVVIAKGREKRKIMLLEGYWPYHPRQLPFGYKLSSNKEIEVDPEKAEIVKRVFNRICNGDPPYRVAREEGFRSPQHISRTVGNPFYTGHFRYAGEIHQGKHKPIVDKEVWEKANTMIRRAREGLKGVFNPPFGFKRVGDKIKIDEGEAEIVKKVFQLRFSERKSPKEIAKETGLSYSIIYKMLHNPHYRKIVGFDLWQKAQDTRISRSEVAKRKRSILEAKIIIFLKDKPNGCGIKEISKGTGINNGTVTRLLKEIKAKGVVNRVYGKKSRKHAKGKWILSQWISSPQSKSEMSN